MSNFTIKLPKNLYRAAQVRELERIAIEDKGISGFKLMQTAAAVVFSAIRDRWPQTRHLIVFVGAGNNGGDGYALAALAKGAGIGVEVIQLKDSDQLKGDARLAFELASDKQTSFHSFSESSEIDEAGHAHTIVVDALLGTGIDRDVTGDYQLAIERINAMYCPVVAVDIPSGLSADTGKCFGRAVEADLTVTFVGMKQGLLTGQGRDFAGEITFASLEVSEEIYTSDEAPIPFTHRIDINDVSRDLFPRRLSSHKGNHGHVVIIGGEVGLGGAALLAAEAAQRAGAGLVSVITRSSHRPAFLARQPEVMVWGTEDENSDPGVLLEKATTIAIGPGLGTNKWSRHLFQHALSAQQAHGTPLVVDADGLNLLAERIATGAPLKRSNWILTPHPGEAATLLNCSTKEIQSDRFSAVSKLADLLGGICLLKGSGSLICDGEDSSRRFLSTEGNAGMATAGMGDVLTGIVASLVGQGLDLSAALSCGVSIHGEAADLAMEFGGEKGMTASDLFPFIRQLVNQPLS